MQMSHRDPVTFNILYIRNYHWSQFFKEICHATKDFAVNKEHIQIEFIKPIVDCFKRLFCDVNLFSFIALNVNMWLHWEFFCLLLLSYCFELISG